ncbi:methyltransferase [Streptomyces sp. NPDC002054]|uniref:methyltransferase n=1 Tax=Streptomyces sp. NPDC002054 TaxID=3154663 RepID=UPI0033328314
MPALPPPRVVRTVEGVRSGLQNLTRKLAPAPFALLELAQGSMVTQAIYAAAELNVADALADGPLTVDELAARVDAHPESLYRLLRLLASHSIFTEQKDGRFALTPMGSALRSDVPMSMRDTAILMGHPTHWEDWAYLVDAVRSGEPSLPKRRGMGAFEFLELDPEYGEVFTRGMGGMSVTETLPLVSAYDFSRYATIVDFCGGQGGLLAGILEKAPNSRGILVDPRIDTNGAQAFLTEAGVANRCSVENRGLFDVPPSGGDAYLLKHIVHDWPEDQALEILRNVREAIGSGGGKLLLMEMVPTPGNSPHSAKLIDLWLMLLVGGKERTPEQYADLLSRAGFALEKIHQTAAAISIIEARPV